MTKTVSFKLFPQNIILETMLRTSQAHKPVSVNHKLDNLLKK